MLIKNLISKEMIGSFLRRHHSCIRSASICCFSTKAIDIKLQELQSIHPKSHNNMTDFQATPPGRSKIPALVNELVEAEMSEFDQFIEEMCTSFIMLIRSKGFTQEKITFELGVWTKKLDSTFLKKRQTQMELLHFASTLKFIMLNNLENLQLLNQTYQHLEKYLKSKADLINRFVKRVCQQPKALPIIRMIGLVGSASKQILNTYLSIISPYIQHFKAPQILILFYQSWRYSYELPYNLISAVYDNPVYLKLSDITQSYYKMLFVQKQRGRISPDCQGIYLPTFLQIYQKETVFNMVEFRKFIKIVKSEIFFTQVQQIRQSIELNMNEFIRLACDSRYSEAITLIDLIDIHMGFAQKSSSGELLLEKIIELSKRSPQITVQSLEYYKLFLRSVFRNAKKELKYQTVDYLNREYTDLTLKVVEIYIKKMEVVWPEMIFEIGDIATQIDVKSSLFEDIQRIFNHLQKNNVLSFKTNQEYTKNVVNFYYSFKGKIKKNNLISLLEEISKMEYPLPGEYYKILNKLIKLSATEEKQNPSTKYLCMIANNLIQPALIDLLAEPTPFINQIDRIKMDLVLSAAHLTKNQMFISLETGQRIIKEKLIYMINSYQYEEIYDILAFCFKFKADDPLIFQNLYTNLSSFIIKLVHSDQYYLNERYVKLYPLFIKLTLIHREQLAQFKNKACFNTLQHMFVKFKDSFRSTDAMNFLILLQKEKFLIDQLKEYIQSIEFQSQILKNTNMWNLEQFAQINESIKKHIDESSSSKNVLELMSKDSNLSVKEINNIFINKNAYKMLVMNKNINPRFEIPEPGTDDVNLQMMYICSKIYQKVSKYSHLGSESQILNQVYLKEEIDYIKRHKIVKINPLNEFMLENRVLPTYKKVQVWKNYGFVSKDLALNNFTLGGEDDPLDSILSLVMQAFLGSYEKMIEVCSKIALNQQFKQKIDALNLNVKFSGSLIMIFRASQSNNENPLGLLIYTTAQSHKILFLMGYLLKKKGHNVIVFNSNDDFKVLQAELKRMQSKKASSKSHIKIQQNQLENEDMS